MRVHVSAILLVAAVVLLAASPGPAQVSPVPAPDAGVRGSGAIPLSYDGAVGMFDINVVRVGGALYGGFRFQEVSSSLRRGHCIHSRAITALEVRGNTAVVRATGYWNNMPCSITVEALDDLSGDWLRVKAVPLGPILIIYDQAGGVTKGGIEIFTRPPAPDVKASGDGLIRVTNNTVGKFSFRAESIGGQVTGSLDYAEYNPMILAIVRPKVRILVPEIESVEAIGSTAVLRGRGTLNGRPAMVEVKAVDAASSAGSVAVRDQFHIRAAPLVSDRLTSYVYQAGGPLVYGDVVVTVAAADTPD